MADQGKHVLVLDEHIGTHGTAGVAGSGTSARSTSV